MDSSKSDTAATDEKLLTRKEVQQLLKCNTVTLWRYTRDGRFPFYRAGRKMFFRRSDILDSIRVNNG